MYTFLSSKLPCFTLWLLNKDRIKGTWYRHILSGILAIAVAPVSSWFIMSGFTGAKVRISLAKFPMRITSVVYEQLLPNKSTNNF